MVVGFLEELKSEGFLTTFIVLGSCGVLDQSIQADKIIIPSSAYVMKVLVTTIK